MASGFFKGIIVGTVISGLAVGTLAILAGLPEGRPPEAAGVLIPAGSEFNQSRVDTWAALPGAETAPESGKISQVGAPRLDDLQAVSTQVIATAVQPEAHKSITGLNLPDAIEADVGIKAQPAHDAPVSQRRGFAALARPETETLAIATRPMDLPALENAQAVVADSPQQIWPEPSKDEQGKSVAVLAELLELPQEPGAENWDVLISQESAAVPLAKPAPAQPLLQQISAAGLALPLDQDAPKGAQIVAATPLAPTSPEIDDVDDLVPDMAITDASASGGQEPPFEGVLEGTIPNEQNAQENGLNGGDLGKQPKKVGFGNLAPNVKINRLPSVADTPAVTEPAPKSATTQTEKALPQLEKYAAEFENPDGKPLMSIILIDDGSSQVDLEELKGFPYPVSIAIDTKWPGAPQAMRAYRDAGFEVLAMVDLPKMAQAADTEVSMAIYLRAVPEAVAVMEGEAEGLQTGRKASAQLAQILAASGLGAVMLPKGLNTAQKLIAREGVPAITVFRDFDSKGQNARTIQRYLDRAVLKAGQEENGVIMVGHLRKETLNALVLWALEDRAVRVALAPVSAVLRGE
jgi:polysaccharide deacetylase 2 family uncharacterized protein YibQ